MTVGGRACARCCDVTNGSNGAGLVNRGIEIKDRAEIQIGDYLSSRLKVHGQPPAMPIRRATATPTLEKQSFSATAETDSAETPDESLSADGEQPASSAKTADAGESKGSDGEPAENGEKADDEAAEEGPEKKDLSSLSVTNGSDKCKDCVAGQCATHCYVPLLRLKDGYKYKKGKVKKVKRTIPAWASVASRKKLPVSNYAGTQNRLDHLLIEAITSYNHRSGVSYQSVMKYIVKKCPDMELDKKKFHIKKAMKKHLEKGTIKQLKGKGLSGTFALGKQPPASKAGAKQELLGDALPLIITRLCEPKEASYNLIKKYLEKHFPSLNIDNRPEVLKSALLKAVERGQLEQITGKGATGTFQLKRTGNQVLLKGGALEDAILAAITAMNEPKTCSTTTLRRHLLDVNKDTKEYHLVANLRRTLTKCKVLGWMEQITGHGLKGTYRLSFPFYPSPSTLYPDKFNKAAQKSSQPAAKSRRRAASSDDEESEEEEEEEEESEEEAPVRKRTSVKRAPPKVRQAPSAGKSGNKRGRGRPLAKKSPAKKAAAPAKRPKTPVVKKMTKRATKRAATPEDSPDESEEEEEAPKGGAKRSKVEEPSAKRPAGRKAKKGGAKRSKQAEATPKGPVGKKAVSKVRRSKADDESDEPVTKKVSPSKNRSTRKSKRAKN
ncbi:heterochromatin protein 1-binding protein 3 isoform X2 [Nerophis ophidion]|uniref:heterochromatin protein 1-binding protein 3 isoform X2 n=1 Tax=Nerophis ophidion TaxID=159077 RepID=UPI002AE09675|nr:heterochromatin protein 1-binding protein 3 isoform X2 [Nerophis ophidion]